MVTGFARKYASTLLPFRELTNPSLRVGLWGLIHTHTLLNADNARNPIPGWRRLLHDSTNRDFYVQVCVCVFLHLKGQKNISSHTSQPPFSRRWVGWWYVHSNAHSLFCENPCVSHTGALKRNWLACLLAVPTVHTARARYMMDYSSFNIILH